MQQKDTSSDELIVSKDVSIFLYVYICFTFYIQCLSIIFVNSELFFISPLFGSITGF